MSTPDEDEEKQRLAHIADAPEDDAARLSLADWFDQHGDPRGEHIRVQLALQQGAFELYRREQELLQACESRWFERLGALTPEPGSQFHPLSFHKGVPSSLCASVADLAEHGPELFDRLPTITRLNLHRYKSERFEPTAVSRLCALDQLRRITDLDLYCGLDDAEFKQLLAAPLERLTKLTLNHNAIGAEGARALSASDVFRRCVSLSLIANPLGDDGLEALTAAPAPNLTQLDLRDTGIGPRGAELLSHAASFEKLEHLDMGRNPLGDDGLERFASGIMLINLQSLALGSAQIGARGLLALGHSQLAPRLRVLNLGDNESLGAEGARALASLASFAHLEVLDLENCRLGDDGARALAQSPHFAHLKELGLRDNEIGHAGGVALADSPWFSHNLELDLWRNEIFNVELANHLFRRYSANIGMQGQ